MEKIKLDDIASFDEEKKPEIIDLNDVAEYHDEQPNILDRASSAIGKGVDIGTNVITGLGATLAKSFMPEQEGQDLISFTGKPNYLLPSASQIKPIIHGVGEGATLGFQKNIIPAINATLTSGQNEDQSYLQQIAAATQQKQDATIKKIEGKVATEQDPNKVKQLEAMLKQLRASRVETKAPEQQTWADRYYELKSGLTEEQDKAAMEHPGTAIIGNIIGSIPTLGVGSVAAKGLAGMGAAGKAASLAVPSLDAIKGGTFASRAGQAAMQSSSIGALQGLQGGEAKLLEGEIGKTAEEMGTGAVGGAIGGAAGLGLIEGATKVPGLLYAGARKTPLLGNIIKGKEFTAEAGEVLGEPKFMNKESIPALSASEAEQEFVDWQIAKKTAGEEIKRLEALAEAKGITSDLKPEIDNLYDKIKSIETGGNPTKEGDKIAALSRIDRIRGKSIHEQKAETDIAKTEAKASRMGSEIPESEIIKEPGEVLTTKTVTPTEDIALQKRLAAEDAKIINWQKKIDKLELKGGDSPQGLTSLEQQELDNLITQRDLLEQNRAAAQKVTAKTYSRLPETTTDLAQAKPSEVRRIKEELREMANNVGGMNPELTRLLSGAEKTTKDALELAAATGNDVDISAYLRAKREYRAWKLSEEKAGFNPNTQFSEQPELVRDLLKTGDIDKIADVVKYLKASGQNEQADKFQQLATKTQEYRQLLKESEKSSLTSTEGVSGAAKDIWIGAKRGLAGVGSGYEYLKQKAVLKPAERIKNFINNKVLEKALSGGLNEAPTMLKDLATKFSTTHYSQVLNRAADAAPSTRAALLYGLYQQEAFREELARVAPELMEEK